MKRNIVIGGGLAGLTAALTLVEAGQPVILITFGDGGLQLSQGTLDVLGYTTGRVENPRQAIAELPGEHPYHKIGAQAVAESVTKMAARLDMVGSAEQNLLLPTAIGALRPTAFAPRSMAKADANQVSSYAVVGVRQLKDFPADLLAGNLNRTVGPGGEITASVGWVDQPPRAGEADPNTVAYASALDNPEFADEFAELVRQAAGEGELVLLPAILGHRKSFDLHRFEQVVQRPVAEVIMQPPAPVGRRIYRRLVDQFKAAGGRYMLGAKVVSLTGQDLQVKVAGRVKQLPFENLVFAPGGFESGALQVDSKMQISEPVLGLPLSATDATGLVTDNFREPQPLFEVGVRTDEWMRVVDHDGNPVVNNLYAAGGILSGAQRWVEKSGDGIAIASANRAAESILGGAR